MKNKLQTTASAISLLITPWLWLASRFAPSLLRITLISARTFLNPRFASMLVDEPLLKIGASRTNKTKTASLQLQTNISLQTTLDLSDTIQRSFYLRGFPNFSFELLRFCDKRTCLFDIGANIGLISCAASHWVPAEQIHSFEPIPAIFERLKENLSGNCPGAKAHCLALSDVNGSFEMVTCSHDSGAASLEKEYRVNRLDELGYPTELQSVHVQTNTFDSFLSEKRLDLSSIKKVAFKIDVEGHELSVLHGMETFLQENTSNMEFLFVVEVHRQNYGEVEQFFVEREFQLIWPDENELASFQNRAGAAIDLIFHRDPKL